MSVRTNFIYELTCINWFNLAFESHLVPAFSTLELHRKLGRLENFLRLPTDIPQNIVLANSVVFLTSDSNNKNAQ